MTTSATYYDLYETLACIPEGKWWVDIVLDPLCMATLALAAIAEYVESPDILVPLEDSCLTPRSISPLKTSR